MHCCSSTNTFLTELATARKNENSPHLMGNLNSAPWAPSVCISAACWWPGHLTCPGGNLLTSSLTLLMSPGLPKCQTAPAHCHDARRWPRLTKLLGHSWAQIQLENSTGAEVKHEGLKGEYVFKRHPQLLSGNYDFDSGFYLQNAQILVKELQDLQNSIILSTRESKIPKHQSGSNS